MIGGGANVVTMSMRLKVWMASVAMLMVAGLLAVRHVRSPAPAAPGGPTGVASWFQAGVGEAPPTAVATVFKTGLEDLPPSLRGTEVDGELVQDAQGGLKVTRGVRNLFDYFLSTRGEEAEAVVLARIRAYIHNHLGPMAATQALHLLDSYMAYLRQLDDVARPSASDALPALAQRLATLERLRAAHFTPDVVLAFFGEDSVYDHYTVDKLTVLAEASLSGPQKATRLRDLRQGLPAELRAHMEVAEQVQTLDQVTAEWAQRGGQASELRSIRETLVGRDAADRLEALDREEAAWQARVQGHLQARAQIMVDPTLSDSTRRTRLQALRTDHFNGPELLRLEALERIADAPQPSTGSSGVSRMSW